VKYPHKINGYMKMTLKNGKISLYNYLYFCKKLNIMKKLLFTLLMLTLYSCGSIDYDEDKEYIQNILGEIYYKGELFSGTLTKHYEDGQLKTKSTYKNGNRDGLTEKYFKDGQLEIKSTYKNGNRDGLTEKYFKDGQLEIKTTFKDDEYDGLYESYYIDGQLKEKITYKNGRIVNEE